MVEWSITVVLKTTVPRGTGGSNPIAGLFFLFVLSFHLDGIEKNCIFAVDNTTENNEETIIANSYRSADANH